MANIYLHFSLIKSSADAPPPPVDLGKSDNTVDVIKLVSIIADDISALSCKPNTSVKSFNGRLRIYSL